MPLPVPLPLPLPLPYHHSQNIQGQRIHPMQPIPQYSRYGSGGLQPIRKEEQIHTDPIDGGMISSHRGWSSQPISPVSSGLQTTTLLSPTSLSPQSRISSHDNRFLISTTPNTGSRSAPVSPSAATTSTGLSAYGRGGMYGAYSVAAPLRNIPHTRPPFQAPYGQY